MSLGPQWCLGVLLGLLLPGQAPRARPGAFGTDLGSPLGAGRRRRVLGRGDATHLSHVGFVADPSVLQDAKQHFGHALRGCSPRTRSGNAFLAAEGRRSCLRSATPRFAAKRYLLLKHCAALVTALQLRSAADETKRN